ncbi:hypothetical protein VP142E351_P0053 [Vibrio phage 142E35-1]|nr:hypothetical protein VP142E351_P0053 [Vibrio phage 142E35-1]
MAVSNRVKLVIINNPNTSAKRLSKLAYVDISQIHRGLRELNIPQHSETRISRLLDVYNANTHRYMDDVTVTKILGYKRERRSVVSHVRSRLMELGYCFAVLTENKSGRHTFKLLYQKPAPGYYRCDDEVLEPGDIDWQSLKESRQSNDMFDVIEIIEELNESGYWTEYDIARELGCEHSKARRLRHALCTDKNVQYHSRGESGKRQYRILDYGKTTTRSRSLYSGDTLTTDLNKVFR